MSTYKVFNKEFNNLNDALVYARKRLNQRYEDMTSPIIVTLIECSYDDVMPIDLHFLYNAALGLYEQCTKSDYVSATGNHHRGCSYGKGYSDGFKAGRKYEAEH